MGNTKGKARKTYSLRVSENAFNNITGYIAYVKHQPLIAIRVGDKIFETINRIEQKSFWLPRMRRKSNKKQNLSKSSLYALEHYIQNQGKRYCCSWHYPW